MEERFLYHIWDAGHLLTPLTTVSGKSVQISYQGQYNTNRGPDFHNAVLTLNGELLRGDVEIHTSAYDWIAHEHHEDPHYNNVILHVVLDAGKQQFTVKENGETTEILELKNQLSDEVRKLLASPATLPAGTRSEYCDLLSAVDNDTLTGILTSFGRSRFRNKVRRFNATLLFSDFDQVFYEGLLESLGYDKNKQNMVNLAQSITLRQIRVWQSEGMSSLELVSILVCSSGLLHRSIKQLPPALAELLETTYEQQKFFARNLQIDWQLFRIRPASHPIHRILALCSLLWNTREHGLLTWFMEQCIVSCSDMKKSFLAFTDCFTRNSLPGAESLPRPGRVLLATIYVNIFLPIASLYAEKTSDPATAESIAEFYCSFPALQDNHIIRHMNRHLSASHVKLAGTRSIYQQGLIEIFHRYCHYHLCTECRTPS